MKRTRILSFLVTLVLAFAFLVQPTAALKASEAGIKLQKYSTYFHKDTGKYGFKLDFYREKGENTNVKVYAYDASGKCRAWWTGEDNAGYAIDFGETSKSFSLDPAKHSGKYTVKIIVHTELSDVYGALYELEFMWHYTIDSGTLVPEIQFKEMSHSVDEAGKKVPCVNVSTKNLKGETVTMYVYDGYGSCIYQETSDKIKDNKADVKFSWYGEKDGQYFKSGKYRVEVKSTKGQEIADTFQFDFPKMAQG